MTHRTETLRTHVGAKSRFSLPRAGLVLMAAIAATQLQGCFVLGAAAVGGTAMVATDRRTAGAQLEDQTIQVKAATQISNALRGNGNVSVNSYNQQVLITGQVPTEAYKQQIQQIVSSIANVKAVANEVVVGPNSTLGEEANDTYITSKVRASFIDDKQLYSQAFKITTSAGIVYLQGIVTQDEADQAAAVASAVSGVQKVVTLFDIITPDQLQGIYSNTSQTPVTPAGSAPTTPAKP
ncbi:MAG: BON domain-containing protein [Proteobacteria bacterium]|nr:BON domain-containing protein [Pseudomonadota bacterium]